MNDKPLGELLIQHRMITQAQLNEACEVQRDTPDVPVGQILCRLGYLRPELLDELLDTLGKRPRLGEILVRRQLLTPERLIHALTLGRKQGIRLGEILRAHRMVEEDDLVQALAEQYDLPVVSLADFHPQRDLARLLNASYARENRLIPIATDGREMTVALACPSKRRLLQRLVSYTGLTVRPVMARESEILQAHGLLYDTAVASQTKQSDSTGFEISEDATKAQDKSQYASEVITSDVDRLVKRIIALGIRDRASDIHFEAAEQGMVVRFRIDGVLLRCDLGSDAALVRTHARQIVSKIKVLCDMDIAERRRPQDSSFKMTVLKENQSRTVDFRVSTVPSNFGESVVIRVLDKRGRTITLDSLGYSAEQIKLIHQALERKTGIILVTGPTGSGKSSTLYATLACLNTPDAKTLTVEDPIEYTMPGITQSEVNEAIGNTFAKMLRAFLRQDPDNIMVGEIRDLETAAIAIRAAMTGHTVLSTLHTNDSTGAVTRLVDIGVEPNLLATTLRCVVAQRLVRRVCPECSAEHLPPAALWQQFGLSVAATRGLRMGKGCLRCNFTGYSGRLPIAEIWLPTQEELLLINHRPDNLTLRREAFAPGRRASLIEDGLCRVLNGETTLEELMRVVPAEQIEACRGNVEFLLSKKVEVGSLPNLISESPPLAAIA